MAPEDHTIGRHRRHSTRGGSLGTKAMMKNPRCPPLPSRAQQNTLPIQAAPVHAGDWVIEPRGPRNIIEGADVITQGQVEGENTREGRHWSESFVTSAVSCVCLSHHFHLSPGPGPWYLCFDLLLCLSPKHETLRFADILRARTHAR